MTRRTSDVDVAARVNHMSRRRVCIWAAAAPAVGWGTQALNRDALQRQIEQNAVSIKADANGDWDSRVSDKLLASIGNARIVMLGEPSHGAGTSFAAKVRLVRLLHQRLGFDVLAWESGIIDLARTEAGLRGDLDPVEAAQRGILRIWSASKECQPLFAYARESHKGSRPLTMVGFDMQLTAPGSLDYFAAELTAFVDRLDPMPRRQAQLLAKNVLNHFGRLYRYVDGLAAKSAELKRSDVTGAARSAALQAWRETEGDALRPVAEDLRHLEEAAGALLQLFRKNGDSAANTHAGFMIRSVASLTGYGANLLENYGRHSAEEAAQYALTRENRRDRINADNLRWLIDGAYRGRKMIIWAHNAHVMNAWYGRGFDSVSLKPLKEGMKPTAVWLAGWFGDALYRIGFTAYQGSDGLVGTVPTVVPAAPAGSIEERLHRLGAPEVFLPLRGNSPSRLSPTPTVSMRIPKYKVEIVAQPAQAFDALYFIDTMAPATLI